METRTYEVYKFDELPEGVKEKAIERYRYINVDFPDWYAQDGLLDLTADEMKVIGVEISDNWWSSKKPKDSRGNIIGEYPAHTGLIKYHISAFDLDRGSYIQFENIEITNDDIFRRWLGVPAEVWQKVSYSFINDRQSNTRIEFYEETDEPLTEGENKILAEAEEIFEFKVLEALKSLRKSYEYLLSDEAVIETLKANDYDFTIEGKID